MSLRKLTLTMFVAVCAVMVAPTTAAFAVPLPSAMTEDAAEVAFDSATVYGTVVPGGSEAAADTRWCFEYGSTDNPGYNQGFLPAVAGDAGAGTSGVPVSVQLTDLIPGGTYRYRLVAVNALGEGLSSTACGTQGGQETDGSEALFTTPTALPTPLVATGPASNILQNTATISGTVNPQGSPTSYEFQIGLDTAYGAEVYGSAGESTEPQPVNVTLQYLQPGTTYHYRLVAVNAGGTTYGADEMLTTPVYPTSLLTPPATAPLIGNPVVAFPNDTDTSNAVKSKAKSKTHKKNSKRVPKKGKKANSNSKSRHETMKRGKKR